MSECMLCNSVYPCVDADVPDVGGYLHGVCPSCRADARLGRAVRAMPELHAVWRDRKTWCVEPGNFYDATFKGDTPEAALAAAGLME